MKNIFKGLLIVLNFIALIIAVMWYQETKEYEPIIVIISQIATIIAIFSSSSSIKISEIKNESEVTVKRGEGSSTIKDINKSKINIEN
jgi:phosphatidylserine synthase